MNRFQRLPTPLLFVYAGTTVNFAGAFVFPLITLYLKSERGLSVDVIGWVLAIGALGLLSGNLVGGWLVDRWSRRRTLLAALLINAAGFLCLSLAFETPWAYAALLFFGYLGSGMYGPAASTIIADLTTGEDRAFAYTVNYVCINLGIALGPLVGGFLAEISFDWIFYGDVSSSLLCAALILLGVPETRRVSAPVQDPDAKPIRSRCGIWLQHRLVLAFSLASLLLIAPLMGLEFAVPLLIEESFAATRRWVGIVYTINAACILALSFPIERHLRGRRETSALVVAALLWCAGLVIIVVGFSLATLLVGTAVWTLGEIVASLVLPTFISRNVPEEVKGRFLSLVDAMRSLAKVICPLTLGWVWQHHGPRPVLFCVLALPVLGALTYAWLGRRVRSSQLTQGSTV